MELQRKIGMVDTTLTTGMRGESQQLVGLPDITDSCSPATLDDTLGWLYIYGQM